MHKMPINFNFHGRPIATAIIACAIGAVALGLGAMVLDFKGKFVWKCNPGGCSLELIASPAMPPENGNQALPVTQDRDDIDDHDQSGQPGLSSKRQQLMLNHETVEP